MHKAKGQYYHNTACTRDEPNTSQSRWQKLARNYHHLRMQHGQLYGYIKDANDSVQYLLFGLVAAVGKLATQEKRDMGGEADADVPAFDEALVSAYIYIRALADEHNVELDASAENHMKHTLGKLNTKEQTNGK